MGMTDSGNNEMKEAPATVPEPLLKTTIGKITYLVGIHFSENSKETMADKIDRMIRRDLQAGNIGWGQLIDMKSLCRKVWIKKNGLFD